MSGFVKLALVLVFLGSGCSQSFTADDAETRMVFRIGDPNAAIDPTSLEAVRQVVEKRLRLSQHVPKNVVEVNAPHELAVLTTRLTESQLSTVQDLVTRPGTLEFALMANSRDHAQLIAEAQANEATTSAQWIPLETGVDGKPVDIQDDGSTISRDIEHDGQRRKEVLVVLGAPKVRVTDASLKTTQRIENEAGRPTTLEFTLNEKGQYLMTRLMGESLPAPDGFKRHLGIILDGQLHSAPAINDVIGNRGIIEGAFTPDEVVRTVICLNAGRLPLPVHFVETQQLRSPD